MRTLTGTLATLYRRTLPRVVHLLGPQAGAAYQRLAGRVRRAFASPGRGSQAGMVLATAGQSPEEIADAVHLEIMPRLGARPTHVFAAPWVERGGADAVLLYHLRVLAAEPENRLVLLTTESAKGAWLDQVPQSVALIELGQQLDGVPSIDQAEVFAGLVDRLRPRVLHIVNSGLAWRALRLHGQRMPAETRVVASLFCDDLNEFDVPVGYAADHFPASAQYVHQVLTDSKTFADELARRTGFDRRRILPLYTPTLLPPRVPHFAKGRPRILGPPVFAGRNDLASWPP